MKNIEDDDAIPFNNFWMMSFINHLFRKTNMKFIQKKKSRLSWSICNKLENDLSNSWIIYNFVRIWDDTWLGLLFYHDRINWRLMIYLKREIPKPQKHIYLMKCNDESLIFVMLKNKISDISQFSSVKKNIYIEIWFFKIIFLQSL